MIASGIGSDKSPDSNCKSHHLLIAGTGRSGTSFLVRYLTELGLDTSLSRRGEGGVHWDKNANAGLEENLLGDPSGLPYVVKSPWVAEYVEQILADPRIEIDAIVIPVRNLVEAATSRAIVELRALHQRAAWMSEMDQTWEVWASTPGGIVYSLNPLDEARLLALAFYKLVWQATAREIPIRFLSFPRIVEDPEYLHRVLSTVMPVRVSEETAFAAHRTVADDSMVRVKGELADSSGTYPPVRGPRYPKRSEVDNVALRRELMRLRGQLKQAEEAAKRQSATIDELRRSTLKVAGLQGALDAMRQRAEHAEAKAAAILRSRSWLATAPFRRFKLTIGKALGRSVS